MSFQVDLALVAPHLEGLIDDAHRRPQCDLGEQALYVFRVKPDATMADPHADPVGLVGAVDQVLRQAQAHGVVPQGVVRPGFHSFGQGIALLSVFFADGFRGVPGGPDLFLDNARAKVRR